MKLSNRTAKLFSIFAACALLLCSCNKNNSEEVKGPVFTVKGTITNAADRNIAVFHIDDNGITEMGSAKLGKNGCFEFPVASPEHFDFYLLNVDSCGTIAFVADSTETITINGNGDNLIEDYAIDGNAENLKIKEISTLRSALEKQVTTMANSKSPAVLKTEREIRELVNEFKENLITQYIVPAPGSISAYFALTLTVGNIPIFNPLADRNDSKCFAAVATSYERLHPDTRHARNVKRIAEQGLNATRQPKTVEVEVEESEATTTGLFDIKLPQEEGDSIALSSLKGKVVMLDFTAYANTDLSSRNIALRELYNKYGKRGFEIYQISLDTREHFWQQSAANLPWVCVRDARGASTILYNVESIPTFFLISKKGEVRLRDAQISDIDKEIEKLLKE